MSTTDHTELSLSKKKYTQSMSTKYEELKNNETRDDLIVTSLRPDDNVVTPDNIHNNDNNDKNKTSKSNSKSKSSKKSKKKRIRSKDDYIPPSKSNYKSFDPFPERDLHPKRAQTANCLTATAPYRLNLNDHNINQNIVENGTNGSSDIISRNNQSSPNLVDNNHRHQHHGDNTNEEYKHYKEDASNLAFPVNPFDHLMPHKDDFGTRMFNTKTCSLFNRKIAMDI